MTRTLKSWEKPRSSQEWIQRKREWAQDKAARKEDAAQRAKGNAHDLHECNNDPSDPWSVCTVYADGGAA